MSVTVTLKLNLSNPEMTRKELKKAIASLLGPDITNVNILSINDGKYTGKEGGLARARKLTKEERSQIAKKAAEARWGKPKKRTRVRVN